MPAFATLLRSLPNFFSLNGASDSAVSEAEADLGINFAKEYRDYVIELGVASANGHEFTGICKSIRLNVVNVTLTERGKRQNVPNEWYVVEQANIDDIVIWQDADGSIYQTAPNSKSRKIANSLSEYVAG